MGTGKTLATILGTLIISAGVARGDDIRIREVHERILERGGHVCFTNGNLVISADALCAGTNYSLGVRKVLDKGDGTFEMNFFDHGVNGTQVYSEATNSTFRKGTNFVENVNLGKNADSLYGGVVRDLMRFFGIK